MRTRPTDGALRALVAAKANRRLHDLAATVGIDEHGREVILKAMRERATTGRERKRDHA